MERRVAQVIDDVHAPPPVCIVGEGDQRRRLAVARGQVDWQGAIARVARFDVGADLCVPPPPEDDEKHRSRLRVSPDQVAWLEERIDEVNGALPPLTSFVVPGGTPLSAYLHVARTVCRRAERDAVALAAQEPMTPEVITYLNRLSDLLFVLARAANGEGGETTWRPGANRS